MAVQLLKRFPIAAHPRKFSPIFFSSYSSPPDEASATQSLVANVVSILTHNRSKSRWNQLHSLYPNGFDPIEFSEITVQLKNNPHLALRFFLWTQNKSLCNHNLLSYSTITHILARGRLKTHAQNVIKTAIRASELKEPGEDYLKSTPLKVFETLVKTYRHCGSAPFVFDLLIKSCLESRKIDPSIEIVRMLLSRGISPKVSTLNSLIYRVCRSRGAEAAYAIYREFFLLDEGSQQNLKRGFRVSPNVHTYNVFMVCYYQEGFVEKVKEIWHEMVEHNCAPSAYSYSVLMSAFCEEGNMEDVEKLWVEMRNKEMKPDVMNYNIIIGGLCKIGDIVRAEEFFREMTLSGVESAATTHEHLIKGYCNIGDVKSALLVYKDMYRKGFRPEDSTLDLMIKLMCDKDKVHEALEILRNAMDKFDLFPKEKGYEALVKGLCNEGRMEEALKLQAEMVGKGFQPNSEIYGAFIDAYVRQGNEEVAEALRKEMLQIQSQSLS
ncbi:hypothetical protein L6164_031956 [Bauhinia variegata]|uniref:Uncharacterized protein n=1 Tax=Bauhinia variegata TaxID=167791 RepID=A0ACB9KM82_BAUVA|nr:hypothetical protein L6164_031956 [Bauhinia variegata]